MLPASFDFATIFAPGSRFDLYFPFPLSPETNRWGNTMAMIGRLKGGATAAGAHAEIRALAPQIVREHPERNNFEGIVRPLSEQISGNVRLAAWVLAGAVGMVMLIVCANLSNLLLARTAARQKEVAIRMALGAGRRRLLAQLLTEGLVLSCSGAVLGLILALGGTRLLTQLDAVSIPLLRDVRTDGAALGFAVILALVTGLVFGVAPALQASGSVMTSALKDASRGSTEGRGRTWVRSALVVSEVAFACVLLVGAGLLIRSLISVLDVKMGFEPARAATIRVDPDSRVTTPAQRVAYFDEVLRRVKEAPGIESAAITDTLPLGRNRTWGAGALGVTYERGKYPLAFVRVVSEGYPAAMGVPLLAGRDLTASDMADKEPVMLVNKTLADTLWPGRGSRSANTCGAGARRRGGASSASSATSGTCRSSRRPATRCTSRRVSATTWPARISSCVRRCRPASSPARCARRSGPSPAPSPATTSARCSSWWTSRCRRAASPCSCSAASPSSRWSWRRSASTR